MCGHRVLNLAQPQVMGILNITPDSFSDGGQLFDGQLLLDAVVKRAEEMVNAGASLLDVGGESTRPGAQRVSEQQELERVVPVVEALAQRFDVVISVDTSTASVMRESARVGAGMINDVRALSREGAMQAAVETGLPVCLMHMQGQPDTMQQSPSYADVVQEVKQFLCDRRDACVAAGLDKSQILFDPGFGFGKTLEHNLALYRALPEFAALAPLLVGVSRKSMIGLLCDRPVELRLSGSLAFAMLALELGASVLRVHDVAATIDQLKVWQALGEPRLQLG